MKILFIVILFSSVCFNNLFASDIANNKDNPPDKTYKIDFKGDFSVVRLEPLNNGYAALIKAEKDYYVCVNNELSGPYMPFYRPDDKTKANPMAPVRSLRPSPDGKCVSYALYTDWKWYIIFGKDKSGPFDEIVETFDIHHIPAFVVLKNNTELLVFEKTVSEPIMFSPQIVGDRAIAYKSKSDKKWYVLSETGKQGPYDEVSGSEYSSPITAYCYVQGNKKFMAVGKDKLGPFEMAYIRIPNINAKTFIGCVKQADGFYLIKGKDKIGPYEGILNVTFSQDQLHTVALVGKIGKLYIVHNKEKYGPFEDVKGIITYSSDFKTISFGAKQNGKWHVFNGKDKSDAFDELGNMNMNLEAPVPCFNVVKNGKRFAIIGKQQYGPFDKSDRIFVLNDYKTLCRLVQKQDKKTLIIGKETYGPFNDLTGYVASKSGNKFAVIVNDNAKFFVLFGKEKLGPYTWAANVTLSPNGDKVAYVIQKPEGLFVVCDNEQSGPYTFIDPLGFSKNSNVLLYRCSQKNTWYYTMGKTKVGPIFDFAMPTEIIISPNASAFSYTLKVDRMNFPKIRIQDKEYPGNISRDYKNILYYDKGNVHILDVTTTNNN